MKTPPSLSSDPPPRIRISEAAALEVALELATDSSSASRAAPYPRVLCTSIGRGQAAYRFAEQWPQSDVTLWYLDQFQQQLALTADAPSTNNTVARDRLRVLCQSDAPDGPFDLAVLPCTIRGEAELHRDLLQQAFLRLAEHGRLITAVDNPDDRWLHDQLKVFDTKVTVHRRENAVVYSLRKTKPLKRIRNFDCEFTFRHREQTIHAISRPGVFSHRRLDSGAKALLDAIEIQTGSRLIDVGCGWGAVALAIAKTNPAIHAYAIDSNARAIDCTRRGAVGNGLTALTASLTCHGDCDQPGTYDVAACNPPYYANFQIAQRFIDAARNALKQAGQMYVVTKSPEWYEENLSGDWRDIRILPAKSYTIVRATRTA